MLDSMYLRSYAKENSTYADQQDNWARICATSFETRAWGTCWWELISCHSQRLIYSLAFVLMWTRVENPASQAGVDNKT